MAKGEKKDVSLTRFLRGGHSDDGKLVQAVFGDADGNEYTLTTTPKAIDRITASLQEIKLMAEGARKASAEGEPEFTTGRTGGTSSVRFLPGSGGKHIVMEVKDPKGRIRQFPLDQNGFKSVVQGLKNVRDVVKRYRAMKGQGEPETAPPDEKEE